MTNLILVIPTSGFRDKELIDTKDALQSKGFKCDIASKTGEMSIGADGLEVTPDITIKDAIIGIDMYEAVCFIGGPGTKEYFDDTGAHELVKRAIKKDKVMAAICIAPMILARTGVLDGKKATVWNEDENQSAYFRQRHINYTGDNVTVDGKIVTANGPDSARDFGLKIAELLENK